MSEIVSGKPINEVGSRPVNTHSRFNNSYRLAGTYRFGEYSPHFVADVVPSDKHELKCGHTLRSYTLGQPLMQGLDIKKDYFFVPLSALIPLNYEKFITIPNIGDDVNPNVGTSLVNFKGLIDSFSVAFKNYCSTLLADNSSTVDSKLNFLIKYVIFGDMIFSNGSLIASLGAHICPRNNKNDNLINEFWSELNDWIDTNTAYLTFTINGNTYYYDPYGNMSDDYRNQILGLHELITRLHDNPDFSVVASAGSLSSSDITVPNFELPNGDDDTEPFDLQRFFAYQIVCAHFFTNDHVDYVYNAELYRQHIYSIMTSMSSALASLSFTYNGISYRYDTLSARYFQSMIYLATSNVSNIFSLNTFLNYLRCIFGYNRSLRFVDYFTGARTQPLAVGDVSVAVNNNAVSIVDTIQAKWIAKLRSQINRVGRRLAEQTKALFPGTDVVKDYHEPIWLGHTQDSIFTDEVDNTGAAQMADNEKLPITSSFSSTPNAERYAFDIDVPNYHGVIIGITYFDISRFYVGTIERPFFHLDRYDKFNAFLQFQGDQKVYKKELDGARGGLLDTAFGYQGAYMEYKQRYNQAFGGFMNDSLPGMLFLADTDRSIMNLNEVSPDYIRSYPAELDGFFKSLSGYSLGTYFHFIMISDNVLTSNRPMAANPQLD